MSSRLFVFRRILKCSKQKISQIYDFYTIDIAHSQLVESDHIFGIVIPDLKKVRDLAVGFFGKLAAYLYMGRRIIAVPP